MPKTDLDHADAIMALPPGSWIIAMKPVTVGDMDEGGTLSLPVGAKVRLSCTTGSSAFGYTEDAKDISFGMREAVAFEAVPNKFPN